MNNKAKYCTRVKTNGNVRRMVSAILMMAAALIARGLYAQTPADTDYFLWVQSPPSFNSSIPSAAMYGVATDTEGNVYAAGSVRDGDPMVDVPLIAYARSGESDRTGRELWRLETTRGTMVGRAVVFGRGNVLYVAGECSGDVDLRIPNWGVDLRHQPEATISGGNYFILKISLDDRNIAWMRRYPSTVDASARRLALNGDSTLYVAGTFKGSLVIDNGVSYNSFGHSAFVSRMNAVTGAVSWFAQADCDSANVADVVPLASGCVLLADFRNRILFGNAGSSPVYTAIENSHGGSDIVLARFTDGGVVQATRTIGGHGDELAGGAVLGKSDEMYVCGSFNDSMSVQSIMADGSGGAPVLDVRTLVPEADQNYGNPTSEDAFVGRYQFDVNAFDWIASAGGSGSDKACGIARRDTFVYVVGSFWDVASFNSGVVGLSGIRRPAHSSGHRDLFVARYTQNGRIGYVKAGAKTDDDWGFAIAAVGDSNKVAKGSALNLADSMRDTTVVVGACAQGAQFDGKGGGSGSTTRYFASLLPTQTDLDILPDSLGNSAIRPSGYPIEASIVNRSARPVRDIRVRITIFYGSEMKCSFDTILRKITNSGDVERVRYFPPDSIVQIFKHLAKAVVASEYVDDTTPWYDTTQIWFGPFAGLQFRGRTHDAFRQDSSDGPIILSSSVDSSASGEVLLGNSGGVFLDFDARGVVGHDGVVLRVSGYSQMGRNSRAQPSATTTAGVEGDTIVFRWQFPSARVGNPGLRMFRSGHLLHTLWNVSMVKVGDASTLSSLGVIIGNGVSWRFDRLVRIAGIDVDSIVAGFESGELLVSDSTFRCAVSVENGGAVKVVQAGLLKLGAAASIRGAALFLPTEQQLIIRSIGNPSDIGCSYFPSPTPAFEIEISRRRIVGAELHFGGRARDAFAGETYLEQLIVKHGSVDDVLRFEGGSRGGPIKVWSSAFDSATVAGRIVGSISLSDDFFAAVRSIGISIVEDDVIYHLTYAAPVNFCPGGERPCWIAKEFWIALPVAARGVNEIDRFDVESTMSDLLTIWKIQAGSIREFQNAESGRPQSASAGLVSVEEPSLVVRPNQVSDFLQIAFHTYKFGRVRISVCDRIGSIVRVVLDELRSAGEGRLLVPSTDIAPGMYFVRLECDGRCVVVPLQVLH